MLAPLSAADLTIATDLLVEGFPERGGAFWAKALATLARFGGDGHPLGFLLVQKNEPVGVILTPSSLRRRADGSLQRIVNLSSWYVRPTHRWRSGVMLKSIIADAGAVYTDLTPTENVRQMLPSLGFAPLNIGVQLSFLPALAALFGGRSGAVRPAVAAEWDAAQGPDWSLIEGHCELDCAPLLVEGPAGETRIVYQHRKGSRVAKLVYIESHERLRPAMGRLAAYLLRRGCAFVYLPVRDKRVGFGSIFLSRGVCFAKGGDFADRTDILGSERILFDV